MAEVTGLRNNALPYPVYGAPFGIVFPYFDADGDLVTGATSPDSEVSKNGDGFADCTNEATEIATNSGMWYLLLTGTEMTADVVSIISKSATAGMKTTPIVLYPKKLVTIRSGTAAGGDTAYITLDASASAVDDYYNGMVCIATIDTNVEVRIISDYTGSNKQAAVTPAWNVAPDADDTFIIKLPDGIQLNQANTTHVSSTAQTAGDIPALVTTIDDFLDTEMAAVLEDTGTTIPAQITALEAALSTDAEIADAVWDEALSGHTTAGTAGKAISDILVDTAEIGTAGAGLTALATQASVNTIDDLLDTEIGTISTAVVTTIPGLLGTPAGASISADIAAIEAQTDDIGAAGAGLTALATQTSVNTIAGYLDTEVAAILAAVDTEVAAIVTAVGTTIPALLGTPAGASLAADILAIDNLVDDLESRLTALRAGYLDNLSAGAVALQGSVDDLEGRLTAARAGYLDNLSAGAVATAASVAALNNLSAAQVNAEVVDALNVDTYAEPGQGAPAATASLAAKIGYLFKAWRNKKTQTATTRTLYADNGTTADQAATDSDDATTYTKGEWGSGA